MARIVKQRVIAGTAAAVFECLETPDRFVDWSTVDTFRYVDEQRGAGAAFRLSERMFGLTTRYDAMITAYDRERHLAFRAISPMAMVDASYRVEPAADGVRVTIVEEVEILNDGVGVVLWSLGFQPFLERSVEQNLERLAALVEGSVRSAA